MSYLENYDEKENAKHLQEVHIIGSSVEFLLVAAVAAADITFIS